jgi:hypothetical protein
LKALTPQVLSEGCYMSRVRFTTARSVFETFPELARKSTVNPTDEPAIVFLRNLSAAQKFEDAVAFCAHLLPRREAVWWGCGSVRSFLRDIPQSRSAALIAAETWVQHPTDQNRLQALKLGTGGDNSDCLTWLAFGAGWAGGMLSTVPNPPVPMPQYLTARAIRIAVLLAAQHIAASERPGRMSACIAEGIKLAERGFDPGGTG